MNVAQLIRELLMVRDQETPVYIGIRGEDGNQDYVPVTHAGGMFMVLEEENKTSLVIALS